MRFLSTLSLLMFTGCAAFAKTPTGGADGGAVDAGTSLDFTVLAEPSFLMSLMGMIGVPGQVAATLAVVIGGLFAAPATRPRMVSASKHLGAMSKDLTVNLVAGVVKDGGSLGEKPPK